MVFIYYHNQISLIESLSDSEIRVFDCGLKVIVDFFNVLLC